MLFVRFDCIYWRCRCTVLQIVVVYTVHLVKLFRIAELVCFSVVPHILMTAKDIADVALDWCTDDDISYEEE